MAKFCQVNLTLLWCCEAVHERIPIKSLSQEWLANIWLGVRLEGIGWTSNMHYCEGENHSFLYARISNEAVFRLYRKGQTSKRQILIHPGLTEAGFEWFNDVFLHSWRKGSNDWNKYSGWQRRAQSTHNQSWMFVHSAFRVYHSNIIVD